MELRHLASFVAVADRLSFSRAAEELTLAQSAVSANVRRLERELGVMLFERTSHTVTLTDAGRALLLPARETLAAADAARDAVAQVRGGLTGIARIGIMQVESVHGLDIVALLSEFRTAHPAVELRVRQLHTAAMIAQVRGGELDCALVAPAGAQVDGLQLHPLSSEPLLLTVSRRHRLASRGAVELSDVAGESFIDGPADWGARIVVDQSFAAAGLQRRVALEINDVRLQARLAAAGLGCAFLAGSSVAGNPQLASQLRLLPIRHHQPVFAIYLAVAALRPLGAAASALVELARRRLIRPASAKAGRQ
jgi:DNA-binding transcriptional LysR family regulator